MSATRGVPRPIDHLVFPTASLDLARGRLTALGFSVAPEGVHPFGTHNACVYLADGSFLEPLAVRDSSSRDLAVLNGNVFVERDKAFRSEFGEEGFSAIVFATRDTAADHARFVDAGLSAGPMLGFSRPFLDAGGSSDTASFHLAFASIPQLYARFFFTCERVNAPKVDRSALERHDNGVLSLAGVTIVADDVAAVVAAVAGITQAEAVRGAALSTTIVLPGSRIDVLRSADFAACFGLGVSSEAPEFAVASFVVADIGVTRDLLEHNAIGYRSIGAALLVPSRSGQGAHFLFEEKR